MPTGSEGQPTAPVHLGLDLLFLVPGTTGGRETYARELLRALRAVRPTMRITTFVNRETAAAGPGFWSELADEAVLLPRASGRARVRWAASELIGVARAAARARVDVLHAVANFAPLHGPFARVLTLHDVLFRERPELMSASLRWATEALVVPAARRAHRVLTVSEASRDAIIGKIGVPASRVIAVPNGIAVPSVGGDAARGRALLGGDDRRPVVLSVATDLPHKNLPMLVAALALMAPAERPRLVFAGHGTDSGTLASRARALGVADDVRLLGAVAAEQLEDLYAAASAFVAPTRHEGFGLPVLEAMARGVPAAASDIPVLREVAGESTALWIDPDAPASIASALRTLLAAGPEIERRRAAGRKRASSFTWTATAHATAAAYDAAIGSRRRRA